MDEQKDGRGAGGSNGSVAFNSIGRVAGGGLGLGVELMESLRLGSLEATEKKGNGKGRWGGGVINRSIVRRAGQTGGPRDGTLLDSQWGVYLCL